MSASSNKANANQGRELERYTTRRGANGEMYPRCQQVKRGEQCNKSTYSNGFCYQHYQESLGADECDE